MAVVALRRPTDESLNRLREKVVHILHRPEPYVSIYNETKERLAADPEREDRRDFVTHRIARTVAAKAFVADLFTEWKQLAKEVQ